MRFAEWMLIVDATAMSDIMDHGHGDLMLCVGYGSCCVGVGGANLSLQQQEPVYVCTYIQNDMKELVSFGFRERRPFLLSGHARSAYPPPFLN